MEKQFDRQHQLIRFGSHSLDCGYTAVIPHSLSLSQCRAEQPLTGLCPLQTVASLFFAQNPHFEAERPHGPLQGVMQHTPTLSSHIYGHKLTLSLSPT